MLRITRSHNGRWEVWRNGQLLTTLDNAAELVQYLHHPEWRGGDAEDAGLDRVEFEVEELEALLRGLGVNTLDLR